MPRGPKDEKRPADVIDAAINPDDHWSLLSLRFPQWWCLCCQD
jgi:hypothetical protein